MEFYIGGSGTRGLGERKDGDDKKGKIRMSCATTGDSTQLTWGWLVVRRDVPHFGTAARQIASADGYSCCVADSVACSPAVVSMFQV
jgi:hypothetical protein